MGRGVFDCLNLRFAAATLQIISGPNGTGKTTLLKLMAGLLAPSSGMCEQRVKGSTGYMGSNFSQLPDLTLFEYISYLHGLNFSDAQDLKGWLKTALEALGLNVSIHTPLRALSSGQAQKVQLARLWTEPHALWLVDEPFAHCDAPTQVALVQKCDQLRKKGILIILTEHNLKPFETIDYQCLDLECL